MKKILSFFITFLSVFFIVSSVFAAYASRFDAINFDPAIDSSDYFTVYGSQTQKAWQGTLGVYFDYANRPLQFKGTGGTTGRQSILDHVFIMDAYGSLAFTDWFTAGINIPVELYSMYFTDDATAAADHGAGMGDVLVMTKFRFLDINKYHVGLSLVPFATLPTGDVVRYAGNGHVTGGAKLVFDGQIGNRFSVALNAGGIMRDDVTRTYTFSGGGTSTIRMDDLLTYGVAANFKFSKYIQGIIESQGSTPIRDFFGSSNTTSLEAGGGARFYIADSGFSVDAGGTGGLIEGVGTPRFRAFVGLRWQAPEPKPCPECVTPDPRIQGNKIVLWGKIFFDTAKTTIKPISFPVLDDVVDVLVKNPHITLVEIQGHTDFRGSDEYNLKLSQGRAEAARQYLISKGIDPSRLTAVGYGESRPIASNDTVEGMSQNRRSEFIILNSSDGSISSDPNPSSMGATDSMLQSEDVYDPTSIPLDSTPTGHFNNAEKTSAVSKVPADEFQDDLNLSLGSYQMH